MKALTVNRGTVFTQLTVIEDLGHGRASFQCSCGRTIVLRIAPVIRQNHKSCGCRAKDSSIYIQHGDALHGAVSKEYWAWAYMKQRCLNSKATLYHRYGGRGIVVCSRWENSYPNFLADMGRAPSSKHSLDRVNNDGNYEPTNCRWATRIQQGRNTSKVRPITFEGRTMLLGEWAESIGLKYKTLETRFRLGWSVEKALTTPLKLTNNLQSENTKR